MAESNAEQRSYWNEQAGPTWVLCQERLDSGIRPHGALASEALAPAPGQAILDVGCGCGDTSLQLAARVAPEGRVVGVDVSGPMLARARERAEEAGCANLSFLQADAQTEALPAASFDGVHSRFGVMFFEDPAAAFANLRNAVKPGGRLAFVCWRPPQENPWVLVPMSAAAPLLTMPPPPPPDAPGMFGLADPERVRTVLEEAGWQEVELVPHELPMSLAGSSVEEATDTFMQVGPVAGALREAGADEAKRAEVRVAVREAYARATAGGPLELGSAVWLVTARNPG